MVCGCWFSLFLCLRRFLSPAHTRLTRWKCPCPHPCVSFLQRVAERNRHGAARTLAPRHQQDWMFYVARQNVMSRVDFTKSMVIFDYCVSETWWRHHFRHRACNLLPLPHPDFFKILDVLFYPIARVTFPNDIKMLLKWYQNDPKLYLMGSQNVW